MGRITVQAPVRAPSQLDTNEGLIMMGKTIPFAEDVVVGTSSLLVAERILLKDIVIFRGPRLSREGLQSQMISGK